MGLLEPRYLDAHCVRRDFVGVGADDQAFATVRWIALIGAVVSLVVTITRSIRSLMFQLLLCSCRKHPVD